MDPTLAPSPARDAGAPHLPTPTIWPCVTAAGIAMLAFGLVTSLAFCAAGAVGMALGLGGWVRELLHEG